MHELHKTLNEHLNSFLEAFNDKIFKEIDWNRPYEVFDQQDLANIFSSPKGNETIYAYTVRAWNTQGQYILFGLKIIVGQAPDDLQIGFSEISIIEEDEDEASTEDDSDDEDAMAREYMIKLTEKLKTSRERQGSEYGKRCTSCGRNDLNLSIMVNAELGETQFVCAVCLSKNQNKTQNRTLEDVNKEIVETEKMIADMEEIISTVEMPDLPDALEKFAVTPLSLYKSFQAILANLKSERMEILNSMDTETKLNVQLEIAIKNEDFEQSAIIRDKLNNLKNQVD